MSYPAILDVMRFIRLLKHNFTLQSLSDKDLTRFKLCVDECIQVMTSVKSENVSVNSFVISWCNQSNQIWFHELYYELWKRSPELNILINIIQKYMVPTFVILSIIQMTFLFILLLSFTQLRKLNVLWLFMFCYCFSSDAELIVVLLLFNTFGKYFTNNNVFCRSKQYISSTLSSVPHWILAEALFNQCLISLKCTNLPPIGVMGAKIIIICSIVSIVVLNSHSLWLYSVDQFERSCSIHSHSQAQIFVIGYPIYIEVIKNIIPGIVIVVCVGILIYYHFKHICQDKNQLITHLCLGINYIFFNMPLSVYWFSSFFSKSEVNLKPFNEVKTNTFLVAITEILADQSNLFVVPIVFTTSSIFRSSTQKCFENLYKRVQKSIKPSQVNIDINVRNRQEIVLPLVKIVDICD